MATYELTFRFHADNDRLALRTAIKVEKQLKLAGTDLASERLSKIVVTHMPLAVWQRDAAGESE